MAYYFNGQVYSSLEDYKKKTAPTAAQDVEQAR